MATKLYTFEAEIIGETVKAYKMGWAHSWVWLPKAWVEDTIDVVGGSAYPPMESDVVTFDLTEYQVDEKGIEHLATGTKFRTNYGGRGR